VQLDLRCKTSDQLRDTMMTGEIALVAVICGALNNENVKLKM
jgi:hypothetical protein